jgi:hypothetical protein
MSGTCSSANSNPATITVNPASVGGSVSGSATKCTGSNNGTLTLSGQTGTIVKWQSSTNGGSTWTDIANTTTTQSYSNLTVTTQYRAVIGGCTTVNSTIATITVSPVSVGGTVSGSTTVCPGSNSGSLTLSGQTGAVIRWESSINGGSTWSTISNTSTSQTYTNLTQTTQFRALVISGACTSAYSTVATITVGSAGNGGVVSGSTSVCSGSNSGTLTLSGQSGTVVKWQLSTNGGSTWTDIANTTTSQSYTNLTQTTLYRAVVSGCSSTINSTAATITVKPTPIVSITASDAANQFCNALTLSANSTLAVQSYMWSTGATQSSINLTTANPAGNYSVIVQSTNGCSGTATYAYNPQTVASSYTILGLNSVSLNNTNTVQSGSIGVTSSSGTIAIGANSSVASTGAFVKAKNLNINPSANVPTRINSPAVVTLPNMQYNTTSTNGLSNITVSNNTNGTLTGNYKNVTIGMNCNITLTGTVFGQITVKAGSRVRFSQSTVNVSGIALQEGSSTAVTQLAFTQGAVVKSNAAISVDNWSIVNPDNYKVVFYLGNTNSSAVDFNVAPGGHISVNASMYIPVGTVSVGGDVSQNTFMTGKFIAGQVTTSGGHVIWNSFNCSTPVLMAADINPTPVTPSVEDSSAATVRTESYMTAQVSPNPASAYFTLRIQSSSMEPAIVKVFDIVGHLVYQHRTSIGEPLLFGSDFAQGVYIIQVVQGEKVQVLKVIKTGS